MDLSKQVKQKSAVELAFVGDAVYELLVREHIAQTVDTNAGTLHRLAVSYVCAEAQYDALEIVKEVLSEEETDIARRGKNASKTTVPRNGTPKTYRGSTALEAVFGYLYLCGRDKRIRELFGIILEARTKRVPNVIE